MPPLDLREIEERYLGGQTPAEFLRNGGDEREYAHQVFTRQIFGPHENPAAPDVGIETEDDLAEALASILAPTRRQLAALDAHRGATQYPALREGAVSRSHNVNASRDTHAAFARLSPAERGDLIEGALRREPG